MSASTSALAPKPPSLYEAMRVDVPEGTSGNVSIERFEIKRDLESLRVAMQGRSCTPGIYTRLMRGGNLWMSDTDAERRDHYGAAIEMQRRGGRVLIGGLGLGMIARAAIVASPVEHLDVLEIDPDVIALVEPWLLDLAAEHGKTVKVMQADVFAWSPPGVRWTVAYFDVWPDLCTDNLEEMAQLGRRYTKRRADVFMCWGRERLRDERRRERERERWWR